MSEHILWQGEQYGVRVEYGATAALYQIIERNPHTDCWHRKWGRDTEFKGYTKPHKRQWWYRQLSIREAAHRAVTRAYDLDLAWQETQRQVNDTRQEATRVDEIRAIVEAI